MEASAPPVKPGWKTSEFWLSTAAIALTVLFASGALTNATALALAGMAATVLTALGYKVSRTLVKTAGALLLVLGIGTLALQSACATVRPRAAAGVGAFLSCESPHVDAGLLEEAKHVALTAIDRWISGDGHVDVAGLKSEAAPLKSDLMRCAFDAAIAAIATPAPSQPGSALAAERAIDGAELLAAHARLRAELGWPAAKKGA